MASRSPPYLYAPWTAQKCQLPERLAIPVLRIAVRGSEIVITASDTDYAMTYHRSASSPSFSQEASRERKTGVSL